MYEMKKLAAQKTIEKKQSKVEEINKLLADEITPTLEKLRKERAAYQQVRLSRIAQKVLLLLLMFHIFC